MKKLSDLLNEVYPVGPEHIPDKKKPEKKFVDKHKVQHIPDRNGNGDDVFKADNVKTYVRHEKRHGYMDGDDKKVYEDHDKNSRELYLQHHDNFMGHLRELMDYMKQHRAELESKKDEDDWFVRHPATEMKQHAREMEDMKDRMKDHLTTEMPEPPKPLAKKESLLSIARKQLSGTKYGNF